MVSPTRPLAVQQCTENSLKRHGTRGYVGNGDARFGHLFRGPGNGQESPFCLDKQIIGFAIFPWTIWPIPRD